MQEQKLFKRFFSQNIFLLTSGKFGLLKLDSEIDFETDINTTLFLKCSPSFATDFTLNPKRTEINSFLYNIFIDLISRENIFFTILPEIQDRWLWKKMYLHNLIIIVIITYAQKPDQSKMSSYIVR